MHIFSKIYLIFLNLYRFWISKSIHLSLTFSHSTNTPYTSAHSAQTYFANYNGDNYGNAPCRTDDSNGNAPCNNGDDNDNSPCSNGEDNVNTPYDDNDLYFIIVLCFYFCAWSSKLCTTLLIVYFPYLRTLHSVLILYSLN